MARPKSTRAYEAAYLLIPFIDASQEHDRIRLVVLLHSVVLCGRTAAHPQKMHQLYSVMPACMHESSPQLCATPETRPREQQSNAVWAQNPFCARPAGCSRATLPLSPAGRPFCRALSMSLIVNAYPNRPGPARPRRCFNSASFAVSTPA
jgi:hypothetical protein